MQDGSMEEGGLKSNAKHAQLMQLFFLLLTTSTLRVQGVIEKKINDHLHFSIMSPRVRSNIMMAASLG
jgi:hypothetical protein